MKRHLKIRLSCTFCVLVKMQKPRKPAEILGFSGVDFSKFSLPLNGAGGKQEDEVHIVFDGSKRTMVESIFKMLSAWAEQTEKLKNGEISKDQYDRWRYTFPAEDTTQIWAKVPSQALSDAIIAAMKDSLTD